MFFRKLVFTMILLLIIPRAWAFRPGKTQIPWKKLTRLKNSSLSFLKKLKLPFNVAIDRRKNSVKSIIITEFKNLDSLQIWGEEKFPPLSNFTPDKIAKKFVKRHLLPQKRDGRQKRDRLKLKTLGIVKSGLISCHVRLAKIFEEIEIFDEDLLVHMDSDYNIETIDGNFDFQIKVTNQVLLNPEKSAEIALKDLNITELISKPIASKILYGTDSGYKFAYKVLFSAREPLGDYRVIVNAENGQVLTRENLIYHATGKGSIYKEHPLNSSVSEAVLKNLNIKSKLKGSWGWVINEDTAEAVSKDGKFIFAPQDTHFDEVNVYFHINRIGEFYKKLNFTMYPIKCIVHVGDKYDNAFFSPWQKTLNFGDGNKLNDLSKEASVIYHEYTHAVTNKMASMRGHEGGCMHEGYSDYFACSIENDPLLGEYVMNKLGKPWMRNLTDTNKHYPEDMAGEIHRDGEIWGSSLWTLRKLLGARVADLIIHESRNYLPSRPTFRDGASGIIKADKKFFNGKHESKIRNVFQKRGIFNREKRIEVFNGNRLVKHLKKFGALFNR
ncbi:M36 family metallopeptidase [Candidatus Riflebacteria bacterium]